MYTASIQIKIYSVEIPHCAACLLSSAGRGDEAPPKAGQWQPQCRCVLFCGRGSGPQRRGARLATRIVKLRCAAILHAAFAFRRPSSSVVAVGGWRARPPQVSDPQHAVAHRSLGGVGGCLVVRALHAGIWICRMQAQL